jgi:hypothetical protein
VIGWLELEERRDAAAAIERGRPVVGDAGETQDLEEDALVIVHERMSGVRVFLHVVGDERAFQRPLELVGYALVEGILRTVAADDWTGVSEEAIEVLSEFPSIVDPGGGETAV